MTTDSGGVGTTVGTELGDQAIRDDIQPVRGESPQGIMTDANIVAVLIARNTHEVELSEKVQRETKNPAVKEFAQMMVKDHGGALDKLRALTVKPEQNDMARQAQDESRQVMSRIANLTGMELDREFARQAVEDHQKTLETLERSMPMAKSDELKSLLTNMRPTVERHLEHARQLQGKVAKRKM